MGKGRSWLNSFRERLGTGGKTWWRGVKRGQTPFSCKEALRDEF